MDTKVLEDIGLTQGEIKVYLALLELGPTTAGFILEKADIQNSVFHFCVNRLIEKGLVSYVKKNKFRIYTAADPDNFKIYLKDKEREVDRILPLLKAKQALAKEKQEVELFEGMKGVITLLNELIDDTRRGDEYLFFPTDVPKKNEEIQQFYVRYDEKRKDKGLITKGIASNKLKPLFKRRAYLKMKYTSTPIPVNVAICNNKMVLITWDKKPTGVLIHSKQLVHQQKAFFHGLWKSLK